MRLDRGTQLLVLKTIREIIMTPIIDIKHLHKRILDAKKQPLFFSDVSLAFFSERSCWIDWEKRVGENYIWLISPSIRRAHRRGDIIRDKNVLNLAEKSFLSLEGSCQCQLSFKILLLH